VTTIGIEAMTEAALDHRKTAGDALTRAARMYEQLAAAQNALRSLGQAYADLKTDNDDLAAENARVRQQRDANAAVVEAVNVWVQHWKGRIKNGATPAQCADVNLLAAVDAAEKTEVTR